MTTTNAQATFGQWIENRRWFRDEDLAFSVALAGARRHCAKLGPAIAAHLGDADPAAPGGWLYFDDALLKRIATPRSLSALARAFPEACPAGPPHGGRHCGLLASVASIGGAVFALPEDCSNLRGHAALFVASLSEPGGHLAVDLERLGAQTAVRVIADSALEWAQSRDSRCNATQPLSLWKS